MSGPKLGWSQSIYGSCWWHWRCGFWCHKWCGSFLWVPDIWRGSCSLQKCAFFTFCCYSFEL